MTNSLAVSAKQADSRKKNACMMPSPSGHGNNRNGDLPIPPCSVSMQGIPLSPPPPSSTSSTTETEFLWTQHLSLPIFAVDTSAWHHILAWNPPAEKLTGISARAVLGRPLAFILSNGQGGRQTKPVSSNSTISSLVDGGPTDCDNVACDESSSSSSDSDDDALNWKHVKESLQQVLRPSDADTPMSSRCEVCLPLPTRAPAGNSATPSRQQGPNHRRYQVTMSTQRNHERDDVSFHGVVCFLEALKDLPSAGGGTKARINNTQTGLVSDGSKENTTTGPQNSKIRTQSRTTTIPPKVHDVDDNQQQQLLQHHNVIDLQEVAAPIFGVDANRRIHLWNSMAAKLFGYSQEEMLGRQIADVLILLREDGSDNDDTTSALTDGKQETAGSMTPTLNSQGRLLVHCVEDVFLHKRMIGGRTLQLHSPLDGSVQTVMVNFLPHFDRSGDYDNPSVDGVILLCCNMNAIPAPNGAKSAQLSGGASRPIQEQPPGQPFNEYQHLIETANSPIFGVDRFGIVNEWNMRIAELTGISKQDAVGVPLLESGAFAIPHMNDVVGSVLDKAYRGRGSSNVELEITTIHRDGETRFLLANVTPRRNSWNEIVGAVAIAEDVTEACNHDRAVAAMANELRQLIDTANAPIFGIDRDGYVVPPVH
jgi:PAS domain S-box-containing protein